MMEPKDLDQASACVFKRPCFDMRCAQRCHGLRQRHSIISRHSRPMSAFVRSVLNLLVSVLCLVVRGSSQDMIAHEMSMAAAAEPADCFSVFP